MSVDAGLFQAGSVPDGYREHLQPVIFAPWAQRLIDWAGLGPGQTVLDVAAGTGVVTRAAAGRVGASGRVIASDISSGMLAHVSSGLDPSGAAVQILECSATELRLEDDSVDAVLCQQGLQFFPDRPAAAREMRRVLRPGGTVALAVWLSGTPLEPFDTYGRVLEEHGVAESFPRAYDVTSFAMSEDEVEQVLLAGGFTDVQLSVQQLELAWPSPRAAAIGITGTPHAPALSALDQQLRDAVVAAVGERFTDAESGAPARHVMTAVLARADVGSA